MSSRERATSASASGATSTSTPCRATATTSEGSSGRRPMVTVTLPAVSSATRPVPGLATSASRSLRPAAGTGVLMPSIPLQPLRVVSPARTLIVCDLRHDGQG
ncbi:hypothetical protein ACFPRL_13880 [Pseudoclavibacter helvolus]